MSTARDMSAANWARTVARLRRNMAELRAHDCQVIEPPYFELPPGRRGLPPDEVRRSGDHGLS